MIKRFLAILVAGLVAFSVTSAEAGFEFRVDSTTTTFSPGDTGTITVFIDVTPPDVGATVTSYNVSVSAMAVGGQSLGDLTFGTTATSANAAFFGPTRAPFSTASLVTVSGGLGAPVITTARTELFTLDWAVSGAAPLTGGFNFSVVAVGANPIFPTELLSGATNVGATLGATPHAINAVPEPTSLGLVGLALVGFGVRRRRRCA